MSSFPSNKDVTSVDFQRKDILILFAHGWDLGKKFDITGNKNSEIILLKDPLILHEDSNFKHLELLEKTTSPQDYLSNLFDYLDLYGNQVCVFDNQEYPYPPDMLLSISKKGTELTGLYNIITKDRVKKDFDFFSFTLSELTLALKENFLLIIFACRSPLTEFQKEGISEQFFKLSKYLSTEKIETIKEKDAIKGLISSSPKENNETGCRSILEYFGEPKGEFIQMLRKEKAEAEEKDRKMIEEMEKKSSEGRSEGYISPFKRMKLIKEGKLLPQKSQPE